MRKRLAIGSSVGLVLLIVALLGFSYSRLEANAQGLDSVRSVFRSGAGAYIKAAGSLLAGNYEDALTAVVEGLEVTTTVAIENGGFLPVYVPSTKHIIFAGEPYQAAADRAHRNPGFWLMPNESRVFEVSALLPIWEIPKLGLNAVLNGGKFEAIVESRIDLAVTTIVRRTSVTGDVLESVRERIK